MSDPIIPRCGTLPDWAKDDPLIVHLTRYYNMTLTEAYDRAERVAIEEMT